MLVLGIQGSPRSKGNTASLLNAFMEEAESLGASTQTVEVYKKAITPCKELLICEEKGYCPLRDDMEKEIYELLWRADLIVMGSPMFFYSMPAQLKALIDRSQAFWARKYRLNMEDPGRKHRKGFLLALGATKGENLFEGASLTAKYFFDAVGARYEGFLSYRKIEKSGDIKQHGSALNEVREKAGELIKPLMNRKKIIFICRENACRSQMSGAFAKLYGGDRFDVLSAGDKPAEKINSVMEEVMREKGIDMGFKKPISINDAIENFNPDYVVTMGCEVSCPVIHGSERIEWDLPDPAGKPIEFMRNLRDEIESKIKHLLITIG